MPLIVLVIYKEQGPSVLPISQAIGKWNQTYSVFSNNAILFWNKNTDLYLWLYGMQIRLFYQLKGQNFEKYGHSEVTDPIVFHFDS